MSVDWTKPLIQRRTGRRVELLCDHLYNKDGLTHVVRVIHDDGSSDHLLKVTSDGKVKYPESAINHYFDIINAPEEKEEIEVWLNVYSEAFNNYSWPFRVSVYPSKARAEFIAKGMGDPYPCARVKVKIRRGQFDE